MGRSHSHISCPACKKVQMQRIERKSWMRYLAASKLYQCKNCGRRVLAVNRWVKLSLSAVPVSKSIASADSQPMRGRYLSIVRELMYLSADELVELKEAIEIMIEKRRKEGNAELKPLHQEDSGISSQP